MIAVIVWALAVLLLVLATIACGIACLFLKDRARLIATDVLLTLATLVVAAFFAANWLSLAAVLFQHDDPYLH